MDFHVDISTFLPMESPGITDFLDSSDRCVRAQSLRIQSDPGGCLTCRRLTVATGSIPVGDGLNHWQLDDPDPALFSAIGARAKFHRDQFVNPMDATVSILVGLLPALAGIFEEISLDQS
jgi:hypothetical protein